MGQKERLMMRNVNNEVHYAFDEILFVGANLAAAPRPSGIVKSVVMVARLFNKMKKKRSIKSAV